MPRPKIEIEQTLTDRIIGLFGIAGLTFLIVLPILFYGDLPDVIPIHFGANGEADGFGGKFMIWFSPVLGAILYLGLHKLIQYPHKFNYPQAVTMENAERLYTSASRMMRVLNTSIVWIFAYIMHSTIQTAIGNQTGLDGSFIVAFVLFMLGTTFYFYYQSRRKNKK